MGSISKFIARGILQAIIFVVIFVIFGFVLDWLLPIKDLLSRICQYGFMTIGLFWVWSVRRHWIWLVLTILSLIAYWDYIF